MSIQARPSTLKSKQLCSKLRSFYSRSKLLSIFRTRSNTADDDDAPFTCSGSKSPLDQHTRRSLAASGQRIPRSKVKKEKVAIAAAIASTDSATAAGLLGQ